MKKSGHGVSSNCCSKSREFHHLHHLHLHLHHLHQEVSRGGQADKQQREFADEGGGGFSPSCISPPYFLPVFPPVFPPCISPPFFMHFQGEASKLKKFKTGLGRRLNDIVGDMQDIRDEGLHSLNELKVEYQASQILTQSPIMSSFHKKRHLPKRQE